MARKFVAAQHPRDKNGRFTKSRTVKATPKDRAAAKAVAEGFTPKQAGAGNRKAYLDQVAGPGGEQGFADVTEANKALRAGKTAPSAAQLEQAMVELPDDVLLSRRVPLTSFGKTDPQALAGMKVRDAGFAPAQFGPVAEADGQVRMRIAVPAGTKAAVNPSTGEVILDRDTEMVVARVEKTDLGHDMYLTVLPKTGGAKDTTTTTEAPAEKTAPEKASPPDGDQPEGGEQVRAELMKLKVPELQAQMRERGLKPGKLRKSQLVDALVADETGSEPDAKPTKATPDAPAKPLSRMAQDQLGQIDAVMNGRTANSGGAPKKAAPPRLGGFSNRPAPTEPAKKAKKVADPDRMRRDLFGQADAVANSPRRIPKDEPAAPAPVMPDAPQPRSFDEALASAARNKKALDAAPLSILPRSKNDPAVTDAMRKSIRGYRVLDYAPVNAALRDPGDAATVKTETSIKNLDDAMSGSKLTEPVVTYRGIWTARLLFGDRAKENLTGITWREDAYVSTSASQETATKFATGPASKRSAVVLRIVAPEGAGGLTLSSPSYESEILLDRGHEFRVAKDHGIGDDGVRILDVEMLPRTGPASARANAPQVENSAFEAKPLPAYKRADDAGLPLAASLKSGIADRKELSGGAVAKTDLVTFKDGNQAVVKVAKPVEGVSARQQQDAEELAPLVLSAAGLRAPQIVRPTANQVVMEHMDGRLAMQLPRSPGALTPDPSLYDNDQIVLLGLADQLTDNYDRHTGNWLVTDTGNIHPIDHGQAFGYPEFRTPGEAMDGKSYGVGGGNQPASAFHDKSRPGGWAANDMHPEDLDMLKFRLAAVRSSFERLGREDWYAKMLTRLDMIRNNATGTTRRLA